jgi:hypothetical protein
LHSGLCFKIVDDHDDDGDCNREPVFHQSSLSSSPSSSDTDDNGDDDDDASGVVTMAKLRHNTEFVFDGEIDQFDIENFVGAKKLHHGDDDDDASGAVTMAGLRHNTEFIFDGEIDQFDIDAFVDVKDLHHFIRVTNPNFCSRETNHILDLIVSQSTVSMSGLDVRSHSSLNRKISMSDLIRCLLRMMSTLNDDQFYANLGTPPYFLPSLPFS